MSLQIVWGKKKIKDYIAFEKEKDEEADKLCLRF